MAEPAPLQVIDRRSGALVEERIFGATALRRIYGAGAVGALLRRVMPLPLVSALYGRWQRTSASRGRIEGFVSELGIDASEAARPLGAYQSLDDFFARRLRAGARPINPDVTALVSPADGRALAFPEVDGALPIKGHAVSLAELLGAPPPFERAAALVVRLAPADYHRFHAPCAGRLGPARPLGGPLHSVHPLALAAGAPSFRNRRQVSLLHSERFGALFLVEVGALLVGEIERTRAPGDVDKGDELGVFHFGGSTVVVVADARRLRLDADLVAGTARGLETLVRVGERVGVHEEPPSGSTPRS